MRTTFLFCLLTLPLISLVQAQAINWTELLYDKYEQFKEPTIKDRRSTHADILPLIQQMKQVPGVTVELLGTSVEGRSIHAVRIGTGPEKVLLWSQMHGDEPTATMAIFDIFNFFRAKDELFQPLREELLSELSLYFIPMLNPDGAEVYERRNAIGLDLNRDALRLQSPEAKILKNMRDRLEADWGFNLHDQSVYYTTDSPEHQATFSFLAPAYNEAKEINEVRKRSMQLIGYLNAIVQQYLPNQVGKYDDTFEPRAFGDNIQKWGTSTILIECGGLHGDPEKQKMRRIHFALLLGAFKAIAHKTYELYETTDYFAIPDNQRNIMDLLIRNATLRVEGNPYEVDIAFRSNEIESSGSKLGFYEKAYIQDLGDLSIYAGMTEVDASGMEVVPGKLFPEVVSDLDALKRMDMKGILRRGYTDVRLQRLPALDVRYQQPLYLHSTKQGGAEQVFKVGQNPSFLLRQNGTFKFAVVNGRLIEL